MEIVNIYEAKTQLSKYIQLLENKQQDSIIIARNGKPVAELRLYTNKKQRRVGIAKGKWRDMSIEEFNDFDMASLFLG